MEDKIKSIKTFFQKNNEQNLVTYLSTDKLILKYILEGILIVTIIRYVLPEDKKFSIKETIIIGICMAIIFSVIDMYSPSISIGIRNGIGFIIGTSLLHVTGSGLLSSL